ncbi:MAG: flippase [Candidatus Portnoybacteria bacterium]|nr:flippase [Candidatus Portnoybacteria bacterium]
MLAKKIAYNTLLSAASRVLSTALALVAVGLITRYLGQGGFGNYSTVLAFLYIFSVLADLGLYSIAVRDVSRDGAEEKEIISQAFSLRFWAGFFIFAAAPLIALLFPYSSETKAGIALASAGYWFLSNAQVLMAIFQKHLKMDRVALAELGGRVAQLLLLAFFIWQKAGFLSIVIAFSVSSFVNFILVWLFARRQVDFKLIWDHRAWKKTLAESFPLAISAILVMIYFKLDTVMLSLMKEAGDVGIYSVAYKVLESLIFFPSMFVGLVMPLLSKYAWTQEIKFKLVSQRAFDILMIFVVPLVVGTFFLSDGIISLIAGQGFSQSEGVLKILILATGFIFFGALFSNIIIALGKQKALAKIYSLGAVINVSVNIIFIPRFSYWAAAFSTLLTEALVTVFMVIFVFKTARYFPQLNIFLKSLAASAVMALILWSLSGFGLILPALAGFILYLLSIFVFRGISFSEIKALFRREI